MFQQVLFNGFLSASIYLLVAIGFALIFESGRFFNFSHGVIFTFGAYSAYFFVKIINFSLLSSVILGVIFGTLLGCFIENFIYKNLRVKKASPTIMMIASLGIYIILQNIISLIFGDDTKIIRISDVKEGYELLSIHMTAIQLTTIIISFSLFLFLLFIIYMTEYGKTFRAVSNDPALANLSGIDSDKVILFSVAIASSFASIAGILYSIDVDMTPTMGMRILMMGIVVFIIGGIGNIKGIVFGAVLLGLTQHFGGLLLGSQWQDAVSFTILLLFLIFKPQGLLGKKSQKATI